MTVVILITFIDLFAFIFEGLIIVRIICTFVLRPDNSLLQALIGITEPVLDPVRRVLPKFQGADFAPFVTFLILQGIQYLISSLFNG